MRLSSELKLPSPYHGDAYSDNEKNQLPKTLRDARDQLLSSKMLKEAFGVETTNHYARAAEWELEEFDSVVTDYEIMRGFEKA